MSSSPSSPSSATSRRQAILAHSGVRRYQSATLAFSLLGDGAEDQAVLCRSLTGEEARVFEEFTAKGVGYPLGYLLQLAVCDPDSKEPLFEAPDRQALEQIDMMVLRPILDVIKEQSGIDDADVAKAMERLKKVRGNGSTS